MQKKRSKIMANNKKKETLVGGYLKHLSGRGLIVMLMYFSVSAIVMMISMQDEKLSYNKMMIVWGIGFALMVAYNFFFTWVNAGADYEMLVSGNMKRLSTGGEKLKISSHKVYKEYRPWKGVVYGVFPAVFSIIFGLYFGANSAEINGTFDGVAMQGYKGWWILLGFLFSGWSLVPFYASNLVGMTPNYYLSLLLILIPIAVSTGGYIAGAYAKRAKVVREQELQDRQREREAQIQKKPNLGALPGTQPKKRK